MNKKQLRKKLKAIRLKIIHLENKHAPVMALDELNSLTNGKYKRLINKAEGLLKEISEIEDNDG